MVKTGFIRRIESLEQPHKMLEQPRATVVFQNCQGIYSIEGKEGLSREEYEKWRSSLNKNVEVLLVSVECKAKNTDVCTKNPDTCQANKNDVDGPGDINYIFTPKIFPSTTQQEKNPID